MGTIIIKKIRVPPMLADIVQATLTSCDGILFDTCEACPHCGGELSGYDLKKRVFARVIEETEEKIVHVQVKRFSCRTCGQICYADQPFYPDTRIGSPVVDLCVTLGETLHFPRISATLADMGILVDRWSVRNYIQKNRRLIPVVDMFGIRVPVSIVSLSSLAMGVRDDRDVDPVEVLAACGYPSREKE